jgi:hypothetical protein
MSCGGHSAVPKVEHASAGWSSVAPSGRSDTARRQSSRRRHDAKAQKAGTARNRQGRSLDQRPLLARRLCTRYWSPLLAGVTGRGHARGGAPEPACRSIWGREPMSERRSRFGPLAAASETVRTAIASVDLRRSKRELPLKEAVECVFSFSCLSASSSRLFRQRVRRRLRRVERPIFRSFATKDERIELVRAHSHLLATRERVSKLVDSWPIELLFRRRKVYAGTAGAPQSRRSLGSSERVVISGASDTVLFSHSARRPINCGELFSSASYTFGGRQVVAPLR